jgi:hypothetical protein
VVAVNVRLGAVQVDDEPHSLAGQVLNLLLGRCGKVLGPRSGIRREWHVEQEEEGEHYRDSGRG